MERRKLDKNLAEEVIARRVLIRKKLLEWGRVNYRPYPWRENRSPYSVLVSEVLLRRTTATAVASIYEGFLEHYPDITSLIDADRDEVEMLLSRIGYHRLRAEILIQMAKYIQAKHGGQVPDEKSDLLEIPHVGQYTANAVLSFGYDIPSTMVDSNIERVILRIFSKHLPNKTPSTVRSIAELMAPDAENQRYHFALLDLGALKCRYDAARCESCPLPDLCDHAGNPESECSSNSMR